MVYWTMGAPIEETIIINRCKKEQTYEYRLLNGTIPMFASFVEALMDSIIGTAMIPKVQIERAVGPILSMFIADVLTETLRDDPALSGRLVMICPEFPLKKIGNSQSTNIDWLMYNIERRQLLFVELKTSDTSVRADQNAIYQATQETIRSECGSFLIKDIEQLRDASREFGKYRYILEKVSPFETEIGACCDARIVYLVPKSAEHKVKDHADRVITFAMLSNNITGSFAEEWKIIQSQLCKLDTSSQNTRNRQLASPERSSNWEGTLNFGDMFDLCLKLGDDIMIGFTGGREEFVRRTLSELKKRPSYKWDFAKNTAGKKQSDWLSGATVVEKLKSHHGY